MTNEREINAASEMSGVFERPDAVGVTMDDEELLTEAMDAYCETLELPSDLAEHLFRIVETVQDLEAANVSSMVVDASAGIIVDRYNEARFLETFLRALEMHTASREHLASNWALKRADLGIDIDLLDDGFIDAIKEIFARPRYSGMSMFAEAETWLVVSDLDYSLIRQGSEKCSFRIYGGINAKADSKRGVLGSQRKVRAGPAVRLGFVDNVGVGGNRSYTCQRRRAPPKEPGMPHDTMACITQMLLLRREQV